MMLFQILGGYCTSNGRFPGFLAQRVVIEPYTCVLQLLRATSVSAITLLLKTILSKLLNAADDVRKFLTIH